jgi:hypothetical protein
MDIATLTFSQSIRLDIYCRQYLNLRGGWILLKGHVGLG